MIKKKKYPFSTYINWVYKAYTLLIIGFGSWAYFHGHLLSYAYQEKLGVSNFNVPIDSTRTEIYGGIEILLDFKYVIIMAFISPALLILLHWTLFTFLNGKIETKKWWVKPSLLMQQLLFYSFLLIPLVPFMIILNPLKEGQRRAKVLIEKPNYEQLIIGTRTDSVIDCKIIYFRNDYVVYLQDSTAHAMSLPVGSQVIHDPSNMGK